MIRRGLRRRCARCGGGDLFVGWFKMRQHCPTCGYRFERAEAFFLGAYTLNLVVVEGLLAVLTVVPCIALLANDPDANIIPVVIAGLVAAVLGPIAFYPFSKTIWTAIDMALGPSGPADDRD